jgi:hypothetical protein
MYLLLSEELLQRYKDKASITWQRDGSAASSGQALLNKYLAGRSKDKLIFLYFREAYKLKKRNYTAIALKYLAFGRQLLWAKRVGNYPCSLFRAYFERDASN